MALVLSTAPASLVVAVTQKQFSVWIWDHRYIIASYYVVSLMVGYIFGLLRGAAERNGRIGAWLADNRFIRPLLLHLGIRAFLEEAPVWYEALRDKNRGDRTFVQVKMKQDGGFYTGELKSYAIVSDSEPNKDFLLINVAYKKQTHDAYIAIDSDGVLLNFVEVESMSFIKQAAASPISE